MRRLSVLLSAAAVAGTVLVSAAPAHADLCYRVRGTGEVTHPVDTGEVCVPYQYAAICFENHTWLAYDFIDLYYDFCVPAG